MQAGSTHPTGILSCILCSCLYTFHLFKPSHAYLIISPLYILSPYLDPAHHPKYLDEFLMVLLATTRLFLQDDQNNGVTTLCSDQKKTAHFDQDTTYITSHSKVLIVPFGIQNILFYHL